jgi:hypothetical protein
VSAFETDSGRAAALTRWAFTDDPAQATQAARRGFLARFEDQVDPDRKLSAEERETRARRLMRAHMIGLSRKARTKKAAAQLRRQP